MKKRAILFTVAMAAVMLIVSLVFAGCSKQESGRGSTPVVVNKIRVGYAPTTMNNPFWQAVLDGVKLVLDAQGVEIVTIDPQNDQSKMNDQIGDLIAQGIDALLIAPVDSTGVRPALVACKEADIPVINFDTPVTDKDLVASIVASDNVNAGIVVAKDMMSKLPRGSKIAIIHFPAGQACIARYDGFIKESNGYFNIVMTPDGRGDTGVTMPIAEDILQGTPDLKAFFAVNDPSAIGCIQAIAGRKASGILVYGVDGAPDAKKAIQAKTMTGTSAQSPIGIGKLTAETALKVIAKQPVEKNIVVPTFIINAGNLSQYNVDGWQ
jgi:ribose transport system substrate-binding protein